MLESSLTHWHCFHQTMKQTEDQHSTNTIENGTSLISNSIDFHLNFIHSIPIIRVLPERHVFPHFQNSHDRENNLVHVITILETILSFPKLCKFYVFLIIQQRKTVKCLLNVAKDIAMCMKWNLFPSQAYHDGFAQVRTQQSCQT